MNNEDYPAIYQATDSASIIAQKYFICLNFGYLLSVILATLSSFLNSFNSFFGVFSVIFFLIGLFTLIIILTKKYENKWYECRAAAESIKTATWRFMMRAEPYEDVPNLIEVKSRFRNLIRAILSQNNAIADYLGGEDSEKDQISSKMLNIRNQSLDERKTFYVQDRIDEQRKWYSHKYVYNKRQNTIWLSLVIFFNFIAVILSIIKISNPQQNPPIDIFAVIAVSSLTWIQLKKFQDLSSSYALTAHEIGTIKMLFDEVKTEKELSTFVIDSENAFSREHTQWVAKRTS